jgi:negative regulator of sigma E activity
MENSTKAMLSLTVTAAVILATVVGVASTTQAADANKGGIPDAHAGTHPFELR